MNQHISSQTDSTQTTLAGELTEFVDVENDILNNVDSSSLANAKTGADRLEHDWDDAEPKLRKIDRKTWTEIDGTIDSVLAAVRSKNPDASKCKSALDHSLAALNHANQ
ncbi:hypothetical protein [Cohnella zeiphila]|uniref:Uncharacterized protein n=1 Tax=Cohnella zeiphila TaxID=2761120 RepID=A0A7X0SR54_9BACL|nr:hypothetical protein [Cohnella zeiphila]MBB6734426.1 hypothetical protein [Cohnella zeiphila]